MLVLELCYKTAVSIHLYKHTIRDTRIDLLFCKVFHVVIYTSYRICFVHFKIYFSISWINYQYIKLASIPLGGVYPRNHRSLVRNILLGGEILALVKKFTRGDGCTGEFTFIWY